jgi:hypothetical protein
MDGQTVVCDIWCVGMRMISVHVEEEELWVVLCMCEDVCVAGGG